MHAARVNCSKLCRFKRQLFCLHLESLQPPKIRVNGPSMNFPVVNRLLLGLQRLFPLIIETFKAQGLHLLIPLSLRIRQASILCKLSYIKKHLVPKYFSGPIRQSNAKPHFYGHQLPSQGKRARSRGLLGVQVGWPGLPHVGGKNGPPEDQKKGGHMPPKIFLW